MGQMRRRIHYYNDIAEFRPLVETVTDTGERTRTYPDAQAYKRRVRVAVNSLGGAAVEAERVAEMGYYVFSLRWAPASHVPEATEKIHWRGQEMNIVSVALDYGRKEVQVYAESAQT